MLSQEPPNPRLPTTWAATCVAARHYENVVACFSEVESVGKATEESAARAAVNERKSPRIRPQRFNTVIDSTKKRRSR